LGGLQTLFQININFWFFVEEMETGGFIGILGKQIDTFLNESVSYLTLYTTFFLI